MEHKATDLTAEHKAVEQTAVPASPEPMAWAGIGPGERVTGENAAHGGQRGGVPSKPHLSQTFCWKRY